VYMNWERQKSKQHEKDALLHHAACHWRAFPRRYSAVFKRKNSFRPGLFPELSSVQEPPPTRRNGGTDKER
jgi:hypothetical protein